MRLIDHVLAVLGSRLRASRVKQPTCSPARHTVDGPAPAFVPELLTFLSLSRVEVKEKNINIMRTIAFAAAAAAAPIKTTFVKRTVKSDRSWDRNRNPRLVCVWKNKTFTSEMDFSVLEERPESTNMKVHTPAVRFEGKTIACSKKLSRWNATHISPRLVEPCHEDGSGCAVKHRERRTQSWWNYYDDYAVLTGGRAWVMIDPEPGEVEVNLREKKSFRPEPPASAERGR